MMLGLGVGGGSGGLVWGMGVARVWGMVWDGSKGWVSGVVWLVGLGVGEDGSGGWLTPGLCKGSGFGLKGLGFCLNSGRNPSKL